MVSQGGNDARRAAEVIRQLMELSLRTDPSSADGREKLVIKEAISVSQPRAHN
mgnify:CR=1 FL=1